MVNNNMKSKKIYLALLVSILLSSLFLSSCSGSSGMMAGTSWPGIGADEEGQIYVAYKTEVSAISLATGGLVWTYPEKADNSQMFYAQPAIYNKVVLVGAYNNKLNAINKDTGTVAWTFDEAQGKYIAGVLVDGDAIYAANGDSSLYALDSSGNELWKFQADGALWAKPAFDEENLYIPSMDHNLYAVNRANGSQVWTVELDGASIFSPVYHEGVLYVGTITGTMYAVNATDGAILWQTTAEGALWSTPAILNGNVYFGDLIGNIYAFDAVSGSQIWKLTTEGSILSGAVALTDAVIFPTEAGDLIAVSESGTKLWTRSVTGKIMGTPVVTGEKIIFGVVGGDALVYAFDFNGNQIWEYSVK
jgi:eukaryotic-like serine/threonine-protein kinase